MIFPRVMKALTTRRRLAVDAYDREGTNKIASGSLWAVDNQIDVSTGTSRLKAVLDNRENTLFPNQFVNVRLLLAVNKGAVIMPAAALQRGPQGTYVYVVKQDQSAEMRAVKPGITEGNEMCVESGFAPGDLVFVDGADRLQSGRPADLNQWAPRLLRKLRTLPKLTDLNSDQQNRGLEASLVIDRDAAARLGVSAQIIDQTLRTVRPTAGVNHVHAA